jgi:hypothetical protein
MEEIKFYQDKALPVTPTSADDGIWFIKEDSEDDFTIYVIKGGSVKNLTAGASTLQEAYDNSTPLPANNEPDTVLTIEDGDVGETPASALTIFNQTILNEVTVTGATEATLLGPTVGTNVLTEAQCDAGYSYEFRAIITGTWTGGTSVDFRFKIGNQSVLVNFATGGSETDKPIAIVGKLSFLDGIVTARRAGFSGSFITDAGLALIPKTILTLDATGGATFDLTCDGDDAGDEFTCADAFLKVLV